MGRGAKNKQIFSSLVPLRNTQVKEVQRTDKVLWPSGDFSHNISKWPNLTNPTEFSPIELTEWLESTWVNSKIAVHGLWQKGDLV